MKLNFSSLAVRIPVMATLVVVLIAGLITFSSYKSATRGLEHEAAHRLQAVAATRAKELGLWLKLLSSEVVEMRDSPNVHQALAAFSDGWQRIGGGAPGAYLQKHYIDQNSHPLGKKDQLDAASDGSDWSAAHARFHPFFRELKDLRGFYDIFLFNPEGELVYTVFKERDFATNLMTGPYAQTGLGEAFRRAKAQTDGKVVFVDFSHYAPSNGDAAGFLAARVTGPDGKLEGVVAAQMPVDRLDALAGDPTGLGKTGHVALIGADGRLRNSSERGDAKILDPVTETPSIKAALAGKSGIRINGTAPESGEPVAIAYQPIDVMGQTWALLAEQSRREFMAEAESLRNRGLIIMACAVVAAVLAGLFMARKIVRPLTSVAGAMDRIAAKDYDFDVPFLKRGDETGAIARNLEAFRAKLKSNEAAEKMAIFKARAFSAAPAAFMLVDRTLEIVDYNDALKKVFNDNMTEIRRNWPDFDPDKLIGVNIDKFHKNPAHQRRILADPANLPYTADIILGETRLQLVIEAIFDDAGDYVGASLEWTDVADTRINSAIMEALRRNQAMMEYDSSFRLRKFNDKFTEVFGWGQEALGKSFEEMFGPNEDTRIGMERLRAGLSVTRKVERPTKSGKTVSVEVVMNPVFNRQGTLDRIVEIGSDVTRLEVARQKAEAEAKEQAKMQQRVVDELRKGLSALAEGDLTVALDTPFAPEYEEVRRDFNAAREKLEELVSQLLASSSLINSGATRIAKASDDLSRRTESQAATLEETSAALHKMTTGLKSTAQGAAEADKAVRDARTDAETSGAVMAQAVDAMGEIQTSSSQISKIIGVIDNIAFQTNLLALNAGVEAARAGEAGRGFAVVASEVRDLAQRSSEAAKEIEDLISASSGHVNHGVRLVGQAGETLQSVLSAVANLSTLVSGIAAAQEEQSLGLSEISAGANDLSEVTQRNASMVDQSTNESHALREQAEQLSNLVSKFRLAGGEGAKIVRFGTGPDDAAAGQSRLGRRA